MRRRQCPSEANRTFVTLSPSAGMSYTRVGVLVRRAVSPVLLAGAALVGGLLSGYDTGVVGGHANIKVPLKAGVGACATKVASPAILRLLQRKGFSLEE